MELRIFVSLFITALASLFIGSIAYLKPAHFGGSLSLERTQRFVSIRHHVSTNDFVIKNVRRIGMGFILSGLLAVVVAVVYSVYLGVILYFNYS